MKLKEAIKYIEGAVTQDLEGTKGYYEALKVILKAVKKETTKYCEDNSHIAYSTIWLENEETYLCPFCDKPINPNKDINK